MPLKGGQKFQSNGLKQTRRNGIKCTRVWTLLGAQFANGVRVHAEYTETDTCTWINAVAGAASNCSYFPNNSGHNVIS